ncbi:MAG: hypothetical protein R6W90_16480 [Ignavibacteriaceae bacterium]
MKRYIYFLAILIVGLFFGCSKDNSISNPDLQGTKKQKSLIELPGTDGAATEATNTFTFNVNGWEGAYQTMYLNFPGGNATVSANYKFPKKVFSGQKTIVITFSNDKASATYTPTPLYFNAPVIANITYTGLNLAGVDPDEVDFVYLPPTGNFEAITYDRLEVNVNTGVIKVVNAKLYHFSKYGFVD